MSKAGGFELSHRRRYVSVALCFLFGVVGCNAESGPQLSKPLQGIIDTSASSISSLDNKLTEAQIDTYIQIKRELIQLNKRYRDIAINNDGEQKVFKRANFQAQILSRALMDEAEFQWVQERIIEAATRLMLLEVYNLNATIIQRLEGLLHFNSARLEKMTDPEERRLVGNHVLEIEQQLDTLRSEHQQRIQTNSALQHNMFLVKARLADLSGIKVVSAYYAE